MKNEGLFEYCKDCPHKDECLTRHWELTFDINGKICDHYLRGMKDVN